MAFVCVVTSVDGVGLQSAKFMPKDKIMVLSDMDERKLEKGVEELRALGYTAYGKTCNIADRSSVQALVTFACSLGEVKTVMHTAGRFLEDGASAEDFLRTNGLGTVYVNQEFSKVMGKKGVIVDLSCSSGYSIPCFLVDKRGYALAEKDETLFLEKFVKTCNFIKDEKKRKKFAYALSKNFVVWYAKKCAFVYGEKGIRVASVSCAFTDSASEKEFPSYAFSTEGRAGKTEEFAYALATVANEKNGYLAGVDILCDGGILNGKKEFKKKR